jgi:hypothetical protein
MYRSLAQSFSQAETAINGGSCSRGKAKCTQQSLLASSPCPLFRGRCQHASSFSQEPGFGIDFLSVKTCLFFSSFASQAFLFQR